MLNEEAGAAERLQAVLEPETNLQPQQDTDSSESLVHFYWNCVSRYIIYMLSSTLQELFFKRLLVSYTWFFINLSDDYNLVLYQLSIKGTVFHNEALAVNLLAFSKAVDGNCLLM